MDNREAIARISALHKEGKLDRTRTLLALRVAGDQARSGVKKIDLSSVGITYEMLHGTPEKKDERSYTQIIRDETFDFIVDYKRNNDGNSPTYRQIMEHFNLASTSAVSARINALVEDGRLIKRGDGNKRTGVIEVVGGSWTYNGASYNGA